MRSALLRFPTAVKRDPAVETWMQEHPGELGALARRWFEVMRGCGDDVRELLHDGHPTACVGDAAFGYVNAFRAHVNVGFFLGARIADPAGLLEGTGKFMRHVKLGPGRRVDATALTKLIHTAYSEVRIAASEELKGSRMKKQQGMSTVGIAVGVAVVVALGAGVFAWQKSMEADRLLSDLNRTRQELEKARADMKKAAQDVAAAAKETGMLKVTTERLTAERDAVRKAMEDQQAARVQMSAELALAKEQISYLSARTSKDVVRGMPKSAR